MAAKLAAHIPISAIQTLSGNTDQTESQPERAGQTFAQGVPLIYSTTGGHVGYVAEWDYTTYTGTIIGVSLQAGQNLSAAQEGTINPALPFGGVGSPGATQTFGSVPNQPLAFNIAGGAPMSDGRTLFTTANKDTLFLVQVDASSGVVFTATQANIGLQYGMTSDGAGLSCYLDLAKIAGGSTAFIVVALDPNTTGQVNNNVWVKFVAVATVEAH